MVYGSPQLNPMRQNLTPQHFISLAREKLILNFSLQKCDHGKKRLRNTVLQNSKASTVTQNEKHHLQTMLNLQNRQYPLKPKPNYKLLCQPTRPDFIYNVKQNNGGNYITVLIFIINKAKNQAHQLKNYFHLSQILIIPRD